MMRLLDLTLDDPPSNLALDEALLLELESGGGEEVLRIWEPAEEFVVVGRGSQVEKEVRCDACAAAGVPILRRCSGGAAIVTGPGCLMYTVVLRTARQAELASVDGIHEFVLRKMARALSGPAARVVRLGISDMGIAPAHKKFSGNSLRLRRGHQADGTALYHGTLLYDFPLHRVETLLGAPPRTPEYRKNRTHAEFLTNLPMSQDEIWRRVREAWNARETSADWPARSTRQLVADRYGQDVWNLRH